MLRSMNQMDGFSIVASDGEVGSVKDVLFDDEHWAVRYLVVDTGGWLTGRTVLISPHAVERVAWSERNVHVRLSKEQVRNGPDIDTDKPVSRQHEASLFNYYGYPYYWAGPYAWGAAAYPMLVVPPLAVNPAPEAQSRPVFRDEERGDPHLRSADAVTGYDIQAQDGGIGHVEDFLFDDMDWVIAMMVVDTRNWWPGRHVLLSLNVVNRVSWDDRAVFVDADRAFIEQSPDFDAARLGQA